MIRQSNRRLDGNPEESRTTIDVSNIRVGGGIIGLVFSVGVFVILLLGVPSLSWFPLGALSAGGVIAAGLWLFHRYKPVRRV